MKVGELGEFGLIALIEGWLKAASTGPDAAALQLGIGDDCAAWQWPEGLQMATVDNLVEGVHFTRDIIDWPSLGWKALAVNISDIAAMGGTPRYGLISLSLPYDTVVSDIEDFYHGMLELAGSTGVSLVGGNITSAPQFSVSVTIIGAATDGKMMGRDGACPGDLVAVTGNVGTAAAGLDLLKSGRQVDSDTAEPLFKTWRRPLPRLAEGKVLLQSGVSTAIDVSDGIVKDLGHICERSDVGARLCLADLPVSDDVRVVFGEKALSLSLGGGEDYELLFCAGVELMAAVKGSLECPVTVIGEITAGDGIILVDGAGRESPADSAGWDHFQGD